MRDEQTTAIDVEKNIGRSGGFQHKRECNGDLERVIDAVERRRRTVASGRDVVPIGSGLNAHVGCRDRWHFLIA